MATFTPLFSITQSSDGLTGTITDLSNYDDNTEDIEVSDFSEREVQITDAYGEDFVTVVFDEDELTAEFEIGDINLWASSTMFWTEINPVGDYEKYLEFPLGRVTENNYQNVLKLGCCSDPVADNALTIADRYLRGGEIAAPAGNSAAWQTDYDAALKYLRSAYVYHPVSYSSN